MDLLHVMFIYVIGRVKNFQYIHASVVLVQLVQLKFANIESCMCLYKHVSHLIIYIYGHSIL